MAQEHSSSFEALIHADRARKKSETLANQIFGRSKSSQSVKKVQKEPRSSSLASRMGVQKRSSSTSVPTQKNVVHPPSRPSSTTPSHSFRPGRDRDGQNSARNARIAQEVESGNANVTTARSSALLTSNGGQSTRRSGEQSAGLSIKGSAGPFTVQLSNFAPGTTEADIESALYSDTFDSSGTSCLQSCVLTATRPAVIAEMVVTDKSVAEKIVNKFHNLKADGRILKVAITKTGAVRDRDSKNSGTHSSATVAGPISSDADVDMDESDRSAQPQNSSSYDHEREAADRDRRDRERDREGYSRRDDREADRQDDRDYDRGKDRDHDRARMDRERPREDAAKTDRDRDRERDRERDRNYEDRNETDDVSNPYTQGQLHVRGNYSNGYNRPRGMYNNAYGQQQRYGQFRGGYRGGGGFQRGYGPR